MSSALRSEVMRVMRASATAPAARWTAVHQQTRRGMATGPDRIKELQKVFNQNPHLHGVDNPTYLKKGQSDVVLASIGGLMVFSSISQVLYFLSQMSQGKGKLGVQ